MSTVSISQSPRCNLLQCAASKLGFGTNLLPSDWGRDNHMTAVRQHGHAAGCSINRCKCNLAQPHSILQCFHVFLIAVPLFCRLCLHGRLLLLSWIRLTIDHPFLEVHKARYHRWNEDWSFPSVLSGLLSKSPLHKRNTNHQLLLLAMPSSRWYLAITEFEYLHYTMFLLKKMMPHMSTKFEFEPKCSAAIKSQTKIRFGQFTAQPVLAQLPVPSLAPSLTQRNDFKCPPLITGLRNLNFIHWGGKPQKFPEISESWCINSLQSLLADARHARHALFLAGTCSSTAPLAGHRCAAERCESGKPGISTSWRRTLGRYLNHHMLHRRGRENMGSFTCFLIKALALYYTNRSKRGSCNQSAILWQTKTEMGNPPWQ